MSVHNASSTVEARTQVKNDEKIATTHDLAQCSLSRLTTKSAWVLAQFSPSRLTTNLGNKNNGEQPRIGGARLNKP